MSDPMEHDAPLSPKTAADLEWAALLDRIAAGCAGAAAVRAVRALAPAGDRAAALARVERVAEAMGCAERGEALPAAGLEELDEVLGAVRRGAVPTGQELRAVAELIAAAAGLRRHLVRHAELAPRLARELATDPGLDAVGARIEQALDPDGAVNDAASPAVREARRRVVAVRRELGKQLEAAVSRHADVLRDRFTTERDGRWVIPVRADAPHRVPGMVLGASASGGTLYVEPAEVTPVVNRLTVALGDVVREEQRVLVELAALAGERGEELVAAQAACVTADVLAAIARWAAAARARPIAPGEAARVDVGSMRHPLLIGAVEDVVPHDLALAAGEALVVSGPNAGGKTVSLKSLGLAVAMARAGLPVPAQVESQIGWFDAILTDFGDEQSIARALSTFSAHVARLSEILAVAGPRTLVLLDELAGATDPEEGAAFAQAIVEALLERGAAVAVTTHYERLKEAAAQDPRFHNASVGFDLERLAPTYRLVLGVPGPSSALAVAAHLGVPAPVVARARALVPEQARARQQLLERLHAEREALHQALASARADADEQERLREVLAAELDAAKQGERRRLAREAEPLMAEVRGARARLREVVAHLSSTPIADVPALEREIDAAARVVALGSELTQRTAPVGPARRPATAAELTPGVRVFLKRLERTAEVIDPPARGQVRVLAGVLKLLVPLGEVELLTGGGGGGAAGAARRGARRARKPAAPATSTLGAGFVPVRTQDNTLDLRGHRVEESLDLVDGFLDRLLDRGEPVGYVLHGHGTGALKLAVRAHLGSSPYVRRSHPAEPDDGGDAFTVAWLCE